MPVEVFVKNPYSSLPLAIGVVLDGRVRGTGLERSQSKPEIEKPEMWTPRTVWLIVCVSGSPSPTKTPNGRSAAGDDRGSPRPR